MKDEIASGSVSASQTCCGEAEISVSAWATWSAMGVPPSGGRGFRTPSGPVETRACPGGARGTGRMEVPDTSGGAMSDQPQDQSDTNPDSTPPPPPPSSRPPLADTIRAKMEEYDVDRH